jgi:hypothetical protein
MLRVLSSPRTLCNGVSRRELLEVGGTSLLGLGLPHLLQAAQSATPKRGGFGSARQCIILFLYGSPSQLETVDFKPEAPLEIRGTMQPIPSSLPGLDVCEHMPHMARMMHKVTVLRSLNHEYPLHGVANAMTGVPAIDVAMELSPNDPRHHPYFASAVEYIDQQRRTSPPPSVPQNVALPWAFSTQRVGEVHRAGPYAAFLGATYNPVWTEWHGEATRSVYKTLGDKKLDVWDPYLGCKADCHFRLASTTLPPELTLDRLDRRRSLLEQFDAARRTLDERHSRSVDKFQDMAYSLLRSTAVAKALDVRQEPMSVREMYGMTLWGQACLAARRMIEAGTRVVSVFWDEFGLAGDAWDTHWNHYPRMIDQLLPSWDIGYAGLINDLDQRGLLDETLVVCISEHGRTPKISSAQGGGRDHWSRAYSALFAGGGIARGRVVGATDKIASDVITTPVSPKDVLATMYHLLGIDPHQFLPDKSGRPIPLLPDGSRVITEMLA